jgi:hypothetical protein
VRVGEADHNMAIIASTRLEALNLLTKQFKENPSLCTSKRMFSARWFRRESPVRPEEKETAQ